MNELFDCRSALFMPASNDKALAKGPTLPADAIIVDLEDSVAPQAKVQARKAAVRALADQDYGYRVRALRINDASSQWFADDLQALAECQADVVVMPKVDDVENIASLVSAMASAGVSASTRIWAMMESPVAVVNANAIAASKIQFPALQSFLIGNNDMARVAGMPVQSDRSYLIPWIMTLIAAARSHGLGLLDGVYNDFADVEGFGQECEQGRIMGMDGKLLIHPSQLSSANKAFSPTDQALEEATNIVELFSLPENSDKGAVSMDGRMIERLHLHMAQALLQRAQRLARRN